MSRLVLSEKVFIFLDEFNSRFSENVVAAKARDNTPGCLNRSWHSEALKLVL